MKQNLKINYELSEKQNQMVDSGHWTKTFFIKQVQISGHESGVFEGSLDSCIEYVNKQQPHLVSKLEIYAGVK
jgi:hypothetical protein